MAAPGSWHFLPHLLQNLLQWGTQEGFGARSSVFYWHALGFSVRGKEQTHQDLQGGKRLSALSPSPGLVLMSTELLGGLVTSWGSLVMRGWGDCCLPGALHCQGALHQGIQSTL